MNNYIFFLIFISFVFANCNKTNTYQRKVIGDWELESIEDVNFRFITNHIGSEYYFRKLQSTSLELSFFHSNNYSSAGSFESSINVIINGNSTPTRYFKEEDILLTGSYEVIEDEITCRNDEQSKTFLIKEITNHKMVLSYYTTKISNSVSMDYSLVFVKK